MLGALTAILIAALLLYTAFVVLRKVARKYTGGPVRKSPYQPAFQGPRLWVNRANVVRASAVAVRQCAVNLQIFVDSSVVDVSWQVSGAEPYALLSKAEVAPSGILHIQGKRKAMHSVCIAGNGGNTDMPWPGIKLSDSEVLVNSGFYNRPAVPGLPTIVLTIPPGTPVLVDTSGGISTLSL